MSGRKYIKIQTDYLDKWNGSIFSSVLLFSPTNFSTVDNIVS